MRGRGTVKVEKSCPMMEAGRIGRKKGVDGRVPWLLF